MPRSFELTCAPALARVLAGGSQPQAGLRQLDVALARDLGHRLFTVLALDWTRGLSVRHYSSAPLAYPPGGAKPIVPGGEFHARVIEAGEPRFCADADAIRAAFPDHELILSLGCESAVNVPVRWNGRTLGSLNLLHEAGWYGEDMLPVLRVYGAMAVPLLQQIHLDRSHDHTTTGKHHEHQASAGRVLLAGLSPAGAQAEARYPSKPITIVYPYAPGSASDTLSRVVGEVLQKALGQPVIVENKPGAGGTIALEYVSRAQPDGHTLAFTASGAMAVSPHLYKLRFTPTEDLAPITTLVEIPFVFVTRADAPERDLQSFIRKARATPGGVTSANAGIGTQAHLTQMLFLKAAGIDLNVIAYKGGAPAVNDLMGGHLDSMIDNAAAQAGYIQAGKVRGLFVTSKYRVAAYPDVPTAEEAGLPGFSAVGWFGLAAPRGTPDAVIQRLNAALVAGLGEPAARKRLTDAGWVPVVGTPEEARERARADLDALGKVVRQIGLQPN